MRLTFINDPRQFIERIDTGSAIWAPFRLLLLLCSWVYGFVVWLRCLLYTHVPGLQKRVAAHVVSVGNITVGGSGKTPIVEIYAKEWMRSSKKVAIVSSGYGRTGRAGAQSNLSAAIRPPEGVRVVSDGTGRVFLGVEEAGDEPYLLARRVPEAAVIVSKNRFTACAFALERLGTEVIVLDDAFQHLRLHRDEDIVALDATNPFGNGHLLPRGILREPPTSLRRASRILLTKLLPGQIEDETDVGAEADLARLESRLRTLAPSAQVLRTVYVPTHLSSLQGETLPLSHITGKKVAAFCGIADPGFFERTLTALGANVVRFRRYRDHYRYTRADVDSVVRDAASCNADAIITTEKDMVRLPQGVSTRSPLYAVAVEIRSAGDESR